MLCPACLKANLPTAHLCWHCNGPLDAFANTDPVMRISSGYHGLGRAMRRPHSLVVIIGLWMFWGISGAAAMAGVTNWGGIVLDGPDAKKGLARFLGEDVHLRATASGGEE